MDSALNKAARSFFLNMMIIIVGFGLFGSCKASDLQSFGQVYPIIEEDFLTFIMNRIKEMQANGEWKRVEDQFRQNVTQHTDRPPIVNAITTTTENKSWIYDPSITVSHPITDQDGKIIIQAGSMVNPLAYVSLHNALIFFNSDDPKQVELVEKTMNRLKSNAKLVLVKGSVFDTEKRFHRPIYFDQEGRLTTKFNIHHVPAVIQQEALVLRISEVKP